MVDLGGYIIILMNHSGKMKLYGSPADSADSLEIGDEILEVNGRTLENATQSEVIQHIHQCIKSRTICLRVRRRSGNKMVLDGPNAGGIRDAWVIAVERGARERLQRLTELRRIQPRDIQAILHQQITEGGAPSTSDEPLGKDATSNQITVTLTDKEPSTTPNAYPAKLSNGTIPKGIGQESPEQRTALEKQQSCPEDADLVLQPSLQVDGVRSGERRASSPFQNGRTEVLIGEPEGGPRSPRGSTSTAVNDAPGFLSAAAEERDYHEPILRSRNRNSTGVPGIPQQHQQQQQEANNVTGGVPKESAGPDEMWAPGFMGHHRELPVDVPDTLLQQAYPNNKVIKKDPARVIVSPASPACQSAEPQSPPGRPLSASDISLDFSKDTTTNTSRRIELNIEEPELLVNDVDVDVIDVDIDDVVEPIGKLIIEDIVRMDTGKVNFIKDPFRTSDDEEDLSGHKESSVDADEDYPFAKEDYPTMLKTCSDDSASPRSSSSRSDSTVPLDNSLVLRSSDLAKDSTMSRNAKLPQIFEKNSSTSFDNPAYGLADFQDIKNLVIRPEQMTDLTLLIGEQTLNKVNGQMNNNKSILDISSEKKSSTINNKKKKRQSTKISSPEAEELLRIGSTDELLSVELASMPRIRKKKQHSSSGYSTLRSDASAEFDQVDYTSFLVVGGNKNYREVAVDCPPDFVPVTKSHPVYPPPNRTPSQSNTLDSKRIEHEIPKIKDKRNENNNDVTLSAESMTLNADNNVVVAEHYKPAETKVRSKSRVRSLLIESLQSFKLPILEHRYTLSACTNLHNANTTASNTKHIRFCTTSTAISPAKHLSTKKSNESMNDTLSKSFVFSSKSTSKSQENLVDEEEDHSLTFKYLAYDNPCLDVSAQIHDVDLYNTNREAYTFTTFLGDNNTNDADDDVDFEKPPVRIELDHDKSRFIQERNQNSRNSLREYRVYFTPNKLENNDLQTLEESPNTQNQNNSRLSLVYRQSKRFEDVKYIEAHRLLSKSELDLSNCSMPTDWSLSRLQSWLSDTQIASSTLLSSDGINDIATETRLDDDDEGEGTKVHNGDGTTDENSLAENEEKVQEEDEHHKHVTKKVNKSKLKS